MVTSWALPADQRREEQPESDAAAVSAAHDAILPRQPVVKFPRSSRFPSKIQPAGPAAADAGAPAHVPALKVPTIKFGKPPEQKAPRPDTREPLSIASAARSMAATRSCSPRATIGRAGGAPFGSGPAAAAPGPGHYEVAAAADKAAPCMPRRTLRGSGIAPFGAALVVPAGSSTASPGKPRRQIRRGRAHSC